MNYYNTYWKKNLKAKSQHTPPVWTKTDFLKILDKLNPYLGKKILDMGCGDGQFLHLLDKHIKNLELTGIDISSIAINKAKHDYPNISFIKSSVTKKYFSDNSFDTILLIEVIEHLIDTDSILKEISKILKPDGFVFITTTDFNLPKKIFISSFFWDKYFYPNNPHIRFFTRNTLREICQQHYLVPIKHYWNGHYFHLMPKGQIAILQNKKNVKT